MATTVGSANVILTAQTSGAKNQVNGFMQALKPMLRGLETLKIGVDTSEGLGRVRTFTSSAQGVLNTLTIKPKVKTEGLARDLKTALNGLPGLQVAITPRPLTQAALNAAISGVKAQKEITLSVNGNASGKLDEIKQKIADIKAAAAQSVTVNTSAVVAVTNLLKSQITNLTALETSLKSLLSASGPSGGRRGTGGGSPGPSVDVNPFAGQLTALQGDLRAGALNSAQFAAEVMRLKSAMDAEIVTLRNLGVLTQGQQKRLDALRVSSGQAAQALKGLGGGSGEGIGKLGRELDIARSKFERGQLGIRDYLRELQRIQGAGQSMAGGLAAGSREAQALERVLKGVSGATAGINTSSVNKARADYSALRREFDAGRISATQFVAEAQNINTRLEGIGRRANLTAQQMNALAVAQQRIARESSTVQGGVNPAGLSGNVLNALRQIPQLAQSIGGPLGMAAGSAAQLGGGLGQITAAAGPLGIAIGAVVVAVGALAVGLKAAISSAADFEAKFAEIRALTQPSIQDFKALQDAAYNIGKPLGVGATAAAGAILELNKAGLSAKDVIGGGLKGALDLAGAAGVSAAEGATLVTSAMTAFGLASRDLPGIADVFANFSNKTFLGAQDLSQAIAAVGPVAKSSGIGLEQFSGIMATLAQGGFKNMSDAGTSLKTMLLSLNAPTDTAKGYLKALGVDIYDSAGKLKPFNQSIGALREQLIKLTPEAQKRVMREIFGQDAIRAAEILLSTGPKAINANTEAMKKQGEAARVARERLDSLKGAASQFSASFEQLKNVIGTPFLAALTGIVRGATSLVDALVNVSKGAGDTGLSFQQMTTASRQALSGLWAAVKPVFDGIAALWNAVLKPALSALWSIWTVIQQAAVTALTVLLNVVGGVFRGIGGLLSGLLGNFGNTTNGVKSHLGNLAANMSRWAETARAYLVAVGTVAGKLPDTFFRMGQSIGLILGGLGKVFGGMALIAYDKLVKPMLPVLDVFKNAFQTAAQFIGDKVTALVKWLGERLAPVADILKALGVGLADSLKGMLAGITDRVAGFVSSGADKVQARAQAEAAAAAEAGAKKVSGGNTLIVDGVKQMQAGYNGLKGAAVDFGNSAQKAFSAVPGQLEDARKKAEALRASLSAPVKGPTGITTVPGQMQSGNVTISEIDARVDAAGGKKGKVTVDQLNALDAYKKKLDAMNISELAAERALQTRLKDTTRLRLVLSEITQRQGELTRATKAQTAEDTRNAEKRTALVNNMRDSIAAYKSLATQGKVTEDVQRRFAEQWRDFSIQVQKLPPALQQGTRALFEQAVAVSNSAKSQWDGTRAAQEHAKASENLARQIGQLAERFRNQVVGGKVSVDSLTSYTQGLDNLKQKLGEIPAQYQGAAAAALRNAQSLVASGQAVINHRSEVDKLKESVKSMTLEELRAAQARVQRAGGDGAEDKLKVINEALRKAEKLDVSRIQKAGELYRQINNAAERFQNAVSSGTVTQDKLTAYTQSLEGFRVKLEQMPPAYRQYAAAALQSAQALVNEGQGVVNRRAEIEKLKESVKSMSIEELRAARQRVEIIGGDVKKLEIIDKEIKSRKELSDAVVNQAQAESGLSLAQAATQQMEGEYQRRQTAANGNLAALYGLELSMGRKLEEARNAQAKAEAGKREAEILARYDKLLSTEGITNEQIAALNSSLTAELKANSDSLTATYQDNANKRVAAEQEANRRLQEEVAKVGKSAADTLLKNALSGVQRDFQRAEGDMNAELSAADLTEQGKLAIRQSYFPRLLALKAQEAAQTRVIEENAENSRYNDAVENARKLGILKNVIAATGLTVEETLLREHTSNMTKIQTDAADTVRDYEIGLKRENGRQIVAAQKETAQQVKEDALKVAGQYSADLDSMTVAKRQQMMSALSAFISAYEKNLETASGKAVYGPTVEALRKLQTETAKNVANLNTADIIREQTEGLDTFTQKQRDAAAAVLQGWLDVYRAMPDEIGGQAVKNLTAALDKLKKATQDTVANLQKLVVSDPAAIKAQAKTDLAAVGKPSERADAEAKAIAQFDGLKEKYNKFLTDIRAGLAQFDGIAADKLTPDQAKLKANLEAALSLYQGLLADVEKEAGYAGNRAGSAYSTAEADRIWEGKQAIIEAEYQFAQSQGRDGSAAYRAGLEASLAYWRARKDALTEGSEDYLKALQKVIDLEGKVRAAQTSGLSMDGLKSQFNAGRNGGMEALQQALGQTAQGFGKILSPMQIFAAILEKINPAGMILEGMFSVLEEPIKALQEPFKTIGTLLGSVLAPILELIAPILELIAELFVALYDAIAAFIKSITFGFVNIDRRTPGNNGKKNPDGTPSAASDAGRLKNENDSTELDRKFQQGLIDAEEYQKERLRLATERINVERDEELKKAKGNAELIAEINRKYDLQIADEKIKIAEETAQQLSEIQAASVENELSELDLKLRKGLISQKEYETEKLKLTLARLRQEQEKEIADANGNEAKIAQIKRKYLLQTEKEQLDALDRINAAYIQIGESLQTSITGSIKGGLLDALKSGNFGEFRQSFRKNIKAAMFDTVASAANETAAFTAILQPAIKALTDALATPDAADDNAAIAGLMEAGKKVESKVKEIYKKLKPLANAWNIGGEAQQSQTLEVVGTVDTPQVKVSLEMLGYLADTIKQVLPPLRAALEAHTPALTGHTAALTPHTAAMTAHTAALPTFVESVGKFQTASNQMAAAAQTFYEGAQLVYDGGRAIQSAANTFATAVGAAVSNANASSSNNTPSTSGKGGGGIVWTPKR